MQQEPKVGRRLMRRRYGEQHSVNRRADAPGYQGQHYSGQERRAVRRSQGERRSRVIRLTSQEEPMVDWERPDLPPSALSYLISNNIESTR